MMISKSARMFPIFFNIHVVEPNIEKSLVMFSNKLEFWHLVPKHLSSFNSKRSILELCDWGSYHSLIDPRLAVA